METDIQSTVAVWQAAGQAHQQLWMFYIAVVSGALGFSFSASFGRAGRTRWALVVLVVLFMVSNVVSLWNNLAIYNGAALALRGFRSIGGAEHISDIPQGLVSGLHLALDVYVIIILWSRACTRSPEPA